MNGLTNCHHVISGPLSAYMNHQEALATVAMPTYAVENKVLNNKTMGSVTKPDAGHAS